jgi:hypothetical protein
MLLTVRETGLLGVGYATVSTVGGISNEHDNHYGNDLLKVFSLEFSRGCH